MFEARCHLFTLFFFFHLYIKVQNIRKKVRNQTLSYSSHLIFLFSLYLHRYWIYSRIIFPTFFWSQADFPTPPLSTISEKGVNCTPTTKNPKDKTVTSPPPLPRIKTNHLAPARNFAAGQSEIQPRLAGKLARWPCAEGSPPPPKVVCGLFPRVRSFPYPCFFSFVFFILAHLPHLSPVSVVLLLLEVFW